MGLIFTDIELINAIDLGNARFEQLPMADVRRMNVRALVDTGAYMLTINETVRHQLGVPKLDEEVAILADGSQLPVDIVGPIEVRFKNRRTTVDAVVIPGDEQILLGAIPLEGMDVVIDTKAQEMTVNPKHPNIAVTILK
ncbi:MAG: clan AA aspartic protease [Candidatus Kapaibacterium sp.]|nr:MAG: clan AA aspartic protease [Candidatus Kapabacteria bacterium]